MVDPPLDLALRLDLRVLLALLDMELRLDGGGGGGPRPPPPPPPPPWSEASDPLREGGGEPPMLS